MLPEGHDIDLEIEAIEQEKARVSLINPEPGFLLDFEQEDNSDLEE